MKLKILFLLVTVCIIMPEKAFAYLDPGTGSLVIQALIAGLAGVGYTIAIYREKIINFFKKRDKHD